MDAAQSGGCAPIVRAIEQGSKEIEPWKNSETDAVGLKVPSPFAGRLILATIRQSGGGAVAVAEQEIEPCHRIAARLEGLNICPEAAVGLAGVRNLVEMGQIDYDEEVILLNTGSGARYYYGSAPEKEGPTTKG